MMGMRGMNDLGGTNWGTEGGMGGMEAGPASQQLAANLAMDDRGYGSNSQMGGMMGGMHSGAGGNYGSNSHMGGMMDGGMESHGRGMGDMSGSMDPSASSKKGGGSSDVEGKGKIFVGGLPRNCSQEQLFNWASQFGGIVAAEVKCDLDGTPRGFGFVTFQEHSVAERLVSNGGRHEMEGKMVACKPHSSWASSTEGSWGSWGSWGGESSDAGPVNPKIFVGGLPKTTTSETLKMHFSSIGNITDIMVKKNPDGSCGGFGFVTFEDPASAKQVLDNYDNNMFEGKWVDCKPADRNGKGGGKADMFAMMAPMMGMMMGMIAKGFAGKGKGGGGKGKGKGPYW
eukprot:TRINITY_DN60518_c0_g1_i1.p1 TRINITY_DN60518_c0_g1~~TRINITY_DN60518_c0_g1_i1.p1  ORF type:complete len:341 (+),score=91.07 TRINITY_DN60518_c0_g1_i1:34-1056(+)